MSNPHIDTFLFDIGNVLVTFDTSRVIRSLASSCDTGASSIEKTLARYVRALEIGELNDTDFLNGLRDAAGFNGDTEALRVAYLDIFEAIVPMHRLVEQLRGKYRLVLFSNTSNLHREWLFARYQVFSHFDDGIYSYVCHAMKPEDGMFVEAKDRRQIDPARTVYFDDSEANIETGRRNGFHSIRYDIHRHQEAMDRLSQLGIVADAN